MTSRRAIVEWFLRAWSLVAFSGDLKPRERRPARYFDRDFVIRGTGDLRKGYTQFYQQPAETG